MPRRLPPVILVMLLGCQPSNRGEVEGRVTLDDKPLDQGSISFFPTGDAKGPSTGAVISQGGFRVDKGVVLGTNRVEIRASGKTGKKIPSAMKPGEMIDEVLDIVPTKYNTASMLTLEVKPGGNKADFALTSEKK